MKAMAFRAWLLPLVLIAVCAIPAGADIFLKEISHSGPYQAGGQTVAAKTDTVKIWLADQKARMDSGTANSVILRADKQMLYIIDHEQKTFSPVSLAEGLEGMMPDDMSAEDAAMMRQMMANVAGSMQFTVTPTNETKKFRDWNARKYIVDVKMAMGGSRSETWASEDLKIDPKLFNQMNHAALAWMPGMAESMKEMEKIQGFPVFTQSTTDMMGSKIERTEELVEYAQRSAPAGAFEIPSGYKEKSMME